MKQFQRIAATLYILAGGFLGLAIAATGAHVDVALASTAFIVFLILACALDMFAAEEGEK